MTRHLRAVPSQPQGITPHDHAAERELLAVAMLESPAMALRALRLVDAADLDHPASQHLHRAMVALAERGVELEPEAIRLQLIADGVWERSGGARTLSEVMDRQGLCGNVGEYARRIRRLSLQRQLLAEWQGGLADVVEGADRTRRAETIADLERRLREVDAPPAVESSADKVHAMLDRMAHPEQRVMLSTGLPELDERLDGGLGQGWLVVVLGAPKMGKTALATNGLGLAAMRAGLPLLYVGEMSEPELMGRWLAAESGVPLRAQRRGDLTPWQWSSVQGAAQTMGGWRWRCEPVAGMARIAASARAYSAQVGRLGLICVDYLQLVSNGNDNRTLDLEETTRGLKLLAAELACPVVLVSQPTNDAAKNKTELGLFDGKGSGSIASDCDLCLVPVREESSDRAGLIAPGYRHGEAFRIPLGSLRFNGARMRFEA